MRLLYINWSSQGSNPRKVPLEVQSLKSFGYKGSPGVNQRRALFTGKVRTQRQRDLEYSRGMQGETTGRGLEAKLRECIRKEGVVAQSSLTHNSAECEVEAHTSHQSWSHHTLVLRLTSPSPAFLVVFSAGPLHSYVHELPRTGVGMEGDLPRRCSLLWVIIRNPGHNLSKKILPSVSLSCTAPPSLSHTLPNTLFCHVHTKIKNLKVITHASILSTPPSCSPWGLPPAGHQIITLNPWEASPVPRGVPQPTCQLGVKQRGMEGVLASPYFINIRPAGTNKFSSVPVASNCVGQ